MAGAGDLTRQHTRGGQRLGGLGRGFHCVDVVVGGAGMGRIARQHPFERSDQLGGTVLGLGAAGRPVIPGRQVHQRFGEQHLQGVVGGKVARGLGHRVGIGQVEGGAVGARIGAVAARHGADHGLLLRLGARGQALRFGGGRHCGRHGLGEHRRVDVGAQHQRLAPEAHRALRVETLRRAEGARCLGMVEGEGEADALVEVGLGALAAGGDRHMQGAEVVVERWWRGLAGPGRAGRNLLAGREGPGFGLGLHQMGQYGRGTAAGGRASLVGEQRVEAGIGAAASGPERRHGRQRHRADDGDGHYDKHGNGGDATWKQARLFHVILPRRRELRGACQVLESMRRADFRQGD